ncbi:ANTAR domain-containing protein [Acidiphilium sp. PA]|uniref:ANTAR domain-containing response regulator n=1 Tax=Acidiphilium sp. PA TaxID=2871705 RepID=UPI002242E641|nr:ANTAR domain-containing protein [Acidiphilium sp. PA]MCW8307204.1 ANTAR domain-containing protein [Acidiphilium sp. PA]
MIREQTGREPAARARQEAALAALDIVVMTPRSADGELLIRELQRTRASVRHCWPAPETYPVEADVIVSEWVPRLAHRLPWVPGQAKAALVVVLPAGPLALDQLHDVAADALLPRPFTQGVVAAIVLHAHVRFAYEQRLRARIDKLDETLRGMRTIERAKAILVETRGIGADDAYHFIRRQAMDRRVTINAVAAAIIDSHELLG